MPHPTWVPAFSAGAALGVSGRTLQRWRSAGLLKPGRHWRRKFPAPNSPVLYDLAAVDEVMRELAARDPDSIELTAPAEQGRRVLSA
jgi:hypothetical protein